MIGVKGEEILMNSNNNNNLDMSKLLSMLSNMDKTQLEQGLAKASAILNSKDKDAVLKQLQNNLKQGKNE